MPSWVDKTWPKGTKVRVVECYSDGSTQYMGEGKLAQNSSITDENCTIILTDGYSISNTACWWVPLELLKKVEIEA
jgi:hypothetical protein